MFVTDTHPLVWYLGEQYGKLSTAVKNAFDEAVVERRSVIFVPVAVLWEMSLNMKAHPGSIELSCSYSELLEALFSIPTVIEEAVTRKIVARSHDLNFHDDPFDTLIVATAVEKDLPLITNDAVIHQTEPCELFWD